MKEKGEAMIEPLTAEELRSLAGWARDYPPGWGLAYGSVNVPPGEDLTGYFLDHPEYG